MTKLSIIMPAYNSEEYIEGALGSLLNQSYDDWEAVVVNDGSTDKTESIVKGYIELHPKKIKYIYQENGGVSKARNTGIRNSTGKYISFLDADDVYFPDNVKEKVYFLDKHPEIGVVFSDFAISDNDMPVLQSTGFLNKMNKYVKHVKEGILFEKKYNYLFLGVTPFPVTTQTIMVKREIIREFREDVSICEDVDLWWYLVRKANVGYINKSCACYQKQYSRLTMDKERYYIDTLKVWHEIDKNGDKDVKELMRKKLAKAYFELGYVYMEKKNRIKSLVNLVKSIGYNPFSLNTYKTIIKVIV